MVPYLMLQGPEQCSKLANEISKVEPTNPFEALDELSKEILKPREIVKSIESGDCSDVEIDYGTGDGKCRAFDPLRIALHTNPEFSAQ